MIFSPLSLPGVYRIEIEKRGDARGFFARAFCAEEFAAHGLDPNLVQINASFTSMPGTVRGLHFQRPPKAEAKVVKCLRGAILDVAVDLREGSATFGQHVAVELTGENRSMLYLPQGFAHGFQTLAPDTELLYLHSEYYSPEHEGGVHHADPTIGIKWPLEVSEVSERDKGLASLESIEPIRL